MQVNKPITDAVFLTELSFVTTSGGKWKMVTADELERYNRDPDAYAAGELGLSIDEYRE